MSNCDRGRGNSCAHVRAPSLGTNTRTGTLPMLWTQRVRLSVHSICAPTAICGGLRAARSLSPQSSSCVVSCTSACKPARPTGLLCRGIAPERHSFGQVRMVRPANTEQNADAVGQGYTAIDAVNSAEAPYRVVNFYHLIDIQNPFQVSYISKSGFCALRIYYESPFAFRLKTDAAGNFKGCIICKMSSMFHTI